MRRPVLPMTVGFLLMFGSLAVAQDQSSTDSTASTPADTDDHGFATLLRLRYADFGCVD